MHKGSIELHKGCTAVAVNGVLYVMLMFDELAGLSLSSCLVAAASSTSLQTGWQDVMNSNELSTPLHRAWRHGAHEPLTPSPKPSAAPNPKSLGQGFRGVGFRNLGLRRLGS